MTRIKQKVVECGICKSQKKWNEAVPAEIVPKPLVETIRKAHPDWKPEGFICLSDLGRFRSEHIRDILEAERGEVSALEHQVMDSLREQEILAKNVNTEFERKLTFGEKTADWIADFGGSWRFILSFFAVIVFWIMLNSYLLIKKPFDPFPFILLNLVLSCLAAVQAPVIMMSQNRQEDRDRMRADHDYRINLKAELEIRHLHEKLDYLLMNQWQRLLEIQEIQTELMEEIIQKQRSR